MPAEPLLWASHSSPVRWSREGKGEWVPGCLSRISRSTRKGVFGWREGLQLHGGPTCGSGDGIKNRMLGRWSLK